MSQQSPQRFLFVYPGITAHSDSHYSEIVDPSIDLFE